MEHLSAEEIIDFVTSNRLDSETLRLASKVNAHISSCEDCRTQVNRYQAIYDEFCRLGLDSSLRGPGISDPAAELGRLARESAAHGSVAEQGRKFPER